MVTAQAALAALTRRLEAIVSYRALVRYLVAKEIKVKSRGTYLGIAWTLVNPLVTIVTYLIVFRYVFRVEVPNFVAYFLVGFLMWVFFSRTITSAATCISMNGAIIKKAPFPLETLPLAAMLYQLFHHVVALTIALPLMLAFGGARVSWQLLWLVGILVAFVLFTLAASLWLSTLGVFFLDTRDILEVGLPLIFWSTPIFYTADMLPPFLRMVLLANPLSTFMIAARAALLDATAPALGDILAIVGWLTVVLLSGIAVFARYSPRFAEDV
jgi:ABC-type polysaccharide/polyol phosphate export permease